MPDLAESIEQLTASLQQLTAERANEVQAEAPLVPETLPVGKLTFSPGVQSFVQRNDDYTVATRAISVGTY